MPATFVAYIDESGDEGFAFGEGSSEWFILSAAMTRRASDLETVRLVDTVRDRLGRPPRKPLHFRDLRHEHRLVLVDEIARGNLRTVSILIHKPSLWEAEMFAKRYRLYFYAVRYLLERVSWYCRDHRTSSDEGDGTIDLVFSNRSGMSYQELREYLDRLREQSRLGDVSVDWNVIRAGQVMALTSGRRMGLQIADAVAGSFFYAVERTQYGFTEDRYARIVKPVVYRYKGKSEGYGLKIWPREAYDVLEEEQLDWLR